jgi:hypothetical protein
MYTLGITIHSQPPHLNKGYLLWEVFWWFHEIFSKYREENQYRVTATSALTIQQREAFPPKLHLSPKFIFIPSFYKILMGFYSIGDILCQQWFHWQRWSIDVNAYCSTQHYINLFCVKKANSPSEWMKKKLNLTKIFWRYMPWMDDLNIKSCMPLGL